MQVEEGGGENMKTVVYYMYQLAVKGVVLCHYIRRDSVVSYGQPKE